MMPRRCASAARSVILLAKFANGRSLFRPGLIEIVGVPLVGTELGTLSFWNRNDCLICLTNCATFNGA
jgi:hypothetical protein